MNRQELEALFLAHLPTIDRIVGSITRRYGFTPDVAADVLSFAKARLIENDYAILAKYRGEAKLATYLTTVLVMLVREARAQEIGRFRPSEAAKREGQLGVLLERLIVRDGLSLPQAGEVLRSAGKTTLSDRELATIRARIPRRTPHRPVEFKTVMPDAPGNDAATDSIDATEARERNQRARTALRRAMDGLANEDRLVLLLRFFSGMSIADIARHTSQAQKPLYVRVERLLKTLRSKLVSLGISPDDIRSILEDIP